MRSSPGERCPARRPAVVGLDSSLVSALAARHREAPLSTFTLGFGQAGCRRAGRRARDGRALGTAHVETTVSPGMNSRRGLPDLLEAYDEPGQSLLQTHWICGLASRDVTVALSGLGGDELFSRLSGHVVMNLLSRVDRIPAASCGPLQRWPARSPVGCGTPRRSPAWSPGRGSTSPHASERRRSVAAISSPRTCEPRSTSTLRRRLLETHFEHAPAEHPLNRMLYVYVKTYLTDELLRASDAMSMLHSMELRTPFLDYRLVERAMRMPVRHKMRWRAGKLRAPRRRRSRCCRSAPRGASEGSRPRSQHWVKDELQEPIRDVLTPSAVRARGLFDPAAVQRLVMRSAAGDARAVAAGDDALLLRGMGQAVARWAPDRRAGQRGLGAPARDPGTIGEPRPLGDHRQLEHARAAAGLPRVGRGAPVAAGSRGDRRRQRVERWERDNGCARVPRGSAGEQRPQRRLWVREQPGDGRRGRTLVSAAQQRHDAGRRLRGALCSSASGASTDIGLAHCRLDFPDGRLQHTAYRFPSLRLALVEDLGLYKLMPKARSGPMLLSGYWDYGEERDVDWVAGAFMLLPRRVFARDRRLRRAAVHVRGGHGVVLPDPRSRLADPLLPERSHRRTSTTRARIFGGATSGSPSAFAGSTTSSVSAMGRPRRVFMAVRVAGAGLRAAYYSTCRALGGRPAQAYRDMRPRSVATLRTLARWLAGGDEPGPTTTIPGRTSRRLLPTRQPPDPRRRLRHGSARRR